AKVVDRALERRIRNLRLAVEPNHRGLREPVVKVDSRKELREWRAVRIESRHLMVEEHGIRRTEEILQIGVKRASYGRVPCRVVAVAGDGPHALEPEAFEAAKHRLELLDKPVVRQISG